MGKREIYFYSPPLQPERYKREILQYYGGSMSDFLSDMSDVALTPLEVRQALSRATGGGIRKANEYTIIANNMLDGKVRAKIRQRALSMELAEKGAAQASQAEQARQVEQARQERARQEQVEADTTQDRAVQLRKKYRNTGRMYSVEKLLAQGMNPDQVESEIQRMESQSKQVAAGMPQQPRMPPAWS